jgi:uncharacterized protein (TIGR02647 family)
MSLNSDFFDELELLSMFDLDNTQSGLKIHHEADPARITAARRLYEKELISLVDGGYLTSHGVEAAKHTQALINILRAN